MFSFYIHFRYLVSLFSFDIQNRVRAEAAPPLSAPAASPKQSAFSFTINRYGSMTASTR